MFEVSTFSIASITHLKLTPAEPKGALRAFFTITLEGNFVIKDWRLLEMQPGKFSVAAPSQLRRVHCVGCSTCNPWGAKFCNQCGESLGNYILPPGQEIYVPVVRVINDAAFWKIRDLALAEYRRLTEPIQATA